VRRGGDCKRQGKYRLGGADQRVVRQLVSAWLVLPPIMNNVHVRRAYELLVTATNFLQSPLLLALRVYFFWQLFLTGKGKLSNIGKVSEFFTSLGIPLPTLNAYFIGSLECFGSLLLIIGLASRPLSLLIVISMTVAYLAADFEAVSNIFSDPDKFVKADPFPFLLTALIILVFGPGLFSI
jgi:putative oxidoreductase